jgi:hypothetical protein
MRKQSSHELTSDAYDGTRAYPAKEAISFYIPSINKSLRPRRLCQSLIMESLYVSSYFAFSPMVQAVSKNPVTLQSVDLVNLISGLDVISQSTIGHSKTVMLNL